MPEDHGHGRSGSSGGSGGGLQGEQRPALRESGIKAVDADNLHETPLTCNIDFTCSPSSSHLERPLSAPIVLPAPTRQHLRTTITIKTTLSTSLLQLGLLRRLFRIPFVFDFLFRRRWRRRVGHHHRPYGTRRRSQDASIVDIQPQP